MEWNEKLNFIFDSQKYNCATVYDCKNNIISDFVEVESQTLKGNLQSILDQFEPQTFRVHFRSAKTVAVEKAHRHYFDTSIIETETKQLPLQGVSNTDIKTQIAQGIQDGLDRIEYKSKLTQIEERESFLQTAGGQIGLLLKEIVPQFLPQMASAPIQGTALPIEIKDDDVKDALEVIARCLSHEHLIELANKLKEKPNCLVPFMGMIKKL